MLGRWALGVVLVASNAGAWAQSNNDADRDAASETGTLKLTAVTPGATYTIDDRPLPRIELAKPIRLGPGRHVLGATLPGAEPLVFPIWITAGKQLETSLTFKSPPPEPTTPPAPPPIAVPSPPPPPPKARGTIPAPATPPTSVAPPLRAPAPVSPTPLVPPPVPTPESPTLLPSAPPPIVTPPPATVTPPPAPVAAPSAPVAPPPPVTPLSPAPVEPAPPAVFPLSVTPPVSEPELSEASAGEAPRIGVILGILAFPRPFEGELVLKPDAWWAVSLKGSLLPELSIPGADFKLDLKAIEGVLRWFPFGGVFYLAGGFGYQSLVASIGDTIDGQELTTSADMSGYFVAPEMGLMWISQSGIALSFGLGLQIPIPKDPVVTATYAGQPVPPQATPAVPQAVVDQAQSYESSVRTGARFIVKYPLPTLDLLRIGVFF